MGFRRIWRWTWRTSLVLVGLGLAYVSIFFLPRVIKWNPVVTPLVADYMAERPDDRAAAQLEDLSVLRKMMKLDRSFTAAERAEFERLVDAMEARGGTIDGPDFAIGLARATTLSNNGHTGFSLRNVMATTKRLPLRLFWFDGELRIVRARAPHQDLLGAEVLRIAQHSPEELFEALRPYWGGSREWERLWTVWFMEAPELLHAAELIPSGQELTLTLKLADATTTERTFEALPAEVAAPQGRRYPWHALLAERLAEEDKDWHFVGQRFDTVPLYLVDPARVHLMKELGPERVLYLRLFFSISTDDSRLSEFYAKAEASIKQTAPKAVVLDLRYDPGGDYTQSTAFLRRLPDLLPKTSRIYVLTGNATFSAALVGVAMIKFYGAGRTLIVGERVGDGERFWAETGLALRLPNSGIRIHYATGYHDWAEGCAGKHPYCFVQNLEYEVPAGSLDPDIPVPLTFEAYSAGRDPALEAVLALVRDSGR